MSSLYYLDVYAATVGNLSVSFQAMINLTRLFNLTIGIKLYLQKNSDC